MYLLRHSYSKLVLNCCETYCAWKELSHLGVSSLLLANYLSTYINRFTSLLLSLSSVGYNSIFGRAG